MITPSYLNVGDKVAIVAPARKVFPLEMECAIHYFQKWGLQVVCSPHLFGSYNQYSGSDYERASDFQMMLDDPEIKAIICARGGYGTIRIIDLINFDKFIQQPKWIVGYSDITVLHSHIHTLGIESLHAIMPINFADEGASDAVESLRKALFGEELEYNCESHSENIVGQEVGMLVGGNLSVLYSLNGSDSDMDTDGKILFIEDLDEYLYHIDRMMQNYYRSKKLCGIKALLVGGMTKMRDNTIPFGKNTSQIIKEYVEDLDIPLCFDFPSGHLANNMALVLGREILLNVSKDNVCVRFKTPEK